MVLFLQINFRINLILKIMYLFKTKDIICITGFLIMGLFSQAQSNTNVNKTYTEWQTSNCGINEDKALIKLLLENVSNLEPLLLDGFQEGPPAEYLENTTKSEMNRMRLNQKLVSEQKIETGLTKEDLQVVTEMSPDDARVQIKKSIINGWKTRALTGLSYLNTDKSNKLLNALAEDQKSPFNGLAKSLLTQNED
jgi:hypothetical protein